ncbi:MAG: DNA-binding response OmpR family regulator [Planctomycetota bacterium]|jgi:DNA-binding response OmpR family regulator
MGPESVTTPSARILIVDDEERIAELVTWFLRRSGHEAVHVRSFEEARQVLASLAPHLLLSDIELGAENAREELPRLSAEGKLPPTLIVSGFLDSIIVEELHALPEVRGMLAKPFDFATLEERICELIKQLESEGVTFRGSMANTIATPQPATTGDAGVAEDDEDEGWIEILPMSSF